MYNFEEITNQAKETLEKDNAVAATNTITLSFYPRTLPNPLKTMFTVVKPQEMTVAENTEEGSTYSKVIRYTVGISIHKAERRDPSDLLSKFSAVLNAFESSNDFTVESAGFDSLKRDPDTNSIVLPGYVTFKMYY